MLQVLRDTGAHLMTLMLKQRLEKEMYAFRLDTPHSLDLPTFCFIFQLKKVTVPVLKAYLKGVGVSAGGKKQDLIDAVNEHLGL